MNWETIKQRFHSLLNGNCRNQGLAALRVTDLEGSIDGKIFLINVLIDIENEILNSPDVGKRIHGPDTKEKDAIKNFVFSYRRKFPKKSALDFFSSANEGVISMRGACRFLFQHDGRFLSQPVLIFKPYEIFF
jgi:hypothetical protein